MTACRVSCLVLCLLPAPLHAQLDETWTVKVGGRSARVAPDGSFRVSNVPAGDAFGPEGPGSRPDFLSDDPLRLTAVGRVRGELRFAVSEPFRIRNDPNVNGDEVVFLPGLEFRDTPPPVPTSLRVAVPERLLGVGETTRLETSATLVDGSQLDVTARSSGTIYRVSNPGIATVGPDGLVTAHRIGTVAVTASNAGAASVVRITVTQEIVEVTVEGFVELDGAPLAGAVVSNAGGGAVTDAEGFFSITFELPIESIGRSEELLLSIEHGGEVEELELVVRYAADAIADLGILRLESAPPPVEGEALFAPSEYPTGLSFSSWQPRVRTVDGDGDGHVDLFVGGDGLSWLRGDGTGRFAAPELLSETEIATLEVGDLEGDGDADIVGAVPLEEDDTSAFQVFRGNGAGSWSADPPFRFATRVFNDAIRFLVLGDFNSDDLLDVAVSLPLHGVTAVFLATVEGGFIESTRELRTNRLASGDFDGDGFLDLVTSSGDVYFGDGNGAFEEDTSAGPRGFPLVADLDGDGRDEILTHLGTLQRFGSDRSSTQETIFDSRAIIERFGGAALADLAGDGSPEFCWIDEGASRQESILGIIEDVAAGDGAPTLHQAPRGPVSVAAADFDEDGDDDLAITSVGSSTLWVNTVGIILDDAGVVPPRPTRFADGGRPTALAVADVDGDGAPDAITSEEIEGCDPSERFVRIYRGLGGSEFEPTPLEEVALGPDEVAGTIEPIDLDADGSLDLALLVRSAENPFARPRLLSVLFGEPGGGFGSRMDVEPAFSPAPSLLFPFDLAGEGRNALMLVNASARLMLVTSPLGESLEVETVELETGAIDAAVADFEDDGDDDVFLYTGSTVAIAINTAGVFEVADEFPASVFGFGRAVGVLPRAGREADLLLLNCTSGEDCPATLEHHVRSGNSFVREDHVITGLTGPRDLLVRDLDQDGALDVVIEARSHFGVLRGLPDGRLAPVEIASPPADTTNGATAADVDGDGDLDLLFFRPADPAGRTCEQGSGFAVSRNRR